VAVILATPGDNPATTPRALTIATVSFDDDHVTGRPATGVPDASMGSAESVIEPATAIVALPGVTRTSVTGRAVTVINALADFPPLDAAIRTFPAATPVTTPD
jgi:hypothetical protein